jgi:hypothetical protein
MFLGEPFRSTKGPPHQPSGKGQQRQNNHYPKRFDPRFVFAGRRHFLVPDGSQGYVFD